MKKEAYHLSDENQAKEDIISQTNQDILGQTYQDTLGHTNQDTPGQVKPDTSGQVKQDVLALQEQAARDGYLHPVFVYGTLMKGQRAEDYMVGSRYLMPAMLSGYSMYNLGSFPGIRPEPEGTVAGEVYFVSDETMRWLDRYEGEGSLYIRTWVRVRNRARMNGDLRTWAYVFNDRAEGEPMEHKWGLDENDYVWYACYGSNLDQERFLRYIEGGTAVNGRTYQGCRDKSLWTDRKAAVYDGTIYFGNRSGSWDGSGVAFYDPDGTGQTHMCLYKITLGQLQDVHIQEGKVPNWYNQLLWLDEVDGCPVYTITASALRPKKQAL